MLKLIQAILAVAFPPFGFVYVWWRKSKRAVIEDMGVLKMEPDDLGSNPMQLPEIDILGGWKIRFWSRFMLVLSLLSFAVWFVFLASLAE